MVAANLHSVYFQARFGGDEPVIRRQSEAFLDLFTGRKRVLDLGSGRGVFLELLRENGIGGYGGDPHPRVVAGGREGGGEGPEGDAPTHPPQGGPPGGDGRVPPPPPRTLPPRPAR